MTYKPRSTRPWPKTPIANVQRALATPARRAADREAVDAAERVARWAAVEILVFGILFALARLRRNSPNQAPRVGSIPTEGIINGDERWDYGI